MLTREEILSVYEQGPEAVVALVEHLQQAITALSARVQALETRLHQDSHNSHKPPSSDGLAKKPVSLRQKTGKKPGAQPGHPGTTLSQVETPDEIVYHAPSTCLGCGHSLVRVEATSTQRRQVFDLPPLRLQVTEHRTLEKVCPHCQIPNQGVFPTDVTQPVQYAVQVKALSVYLMQYQLLPFARTQELLSDLLGSSLCEGTLASLLAECHQRLAPVEAVIKEAIAEAKVAHFDETGMRIEGKLHWLHSSSTSHLTFYAHHPKRGRDALHQIGILPVFTGRSVQDAWFSYFGYACSHALCNAHLLREWIGLYEQTPLPWMRRMTVLLRWVKRAVDRHKAAGATRLPTERLAAYEACYLRLIEQGWAHNPPSVPRGKRGKPKQTPARNLLERLDTYRAEVLAFAYDFAVPFDNNLAERDLRMLKVRQKVSGCFRSVDGASQFCRIRGYISTLRKQGMDLMQALQSVFARQPVYPLLA